MDGLHFSSAIFYSRGCHSVVPNCPWRWVAGSPAASAQGLPGSRRTHCDASRRQAWARVSRSTHDVTARHEGPRRGSTTARTGLSCFSLC